ncbi:MAG: hypothetical protein WAQ28_18335 [Bacteroidia bacterium]|jgi:DNA invertase Pin-like site-specific DNA recombinase
MFELSKNILEKVSFDKALFRKELTKAMQWLKPEEKMLLIVWCISTFGNKYSDVISEVSKNVTRS